MANIELDGVNKKIKVDSGDLTLDVPGDIVLDADGGDVVFADGGTNLLKVTNSSSDVVLQPQVDTKDIVFKQYDGTVVATVEDNATFNIPTDKLAINGTAVTATAAEINLIDGGTARGTTAIADGDGVLINDAGTMRQTTVETLKTYIGGFDVSSITGATALAAQPAADDEIVLSDAGTLKRLDIKHIQNTPAFHAYKSGSAQTVANNTVTKITFETEVFDSDGCYDASTNHRFTPGIAGKYFLYYQMKNANQTDYIYSRIRKNGSDVQLEIHYTGSDVDDMAKGFVIVDSDADDYFEVHLQQTKGSNASVPTGEQNTFFGGFRIAGV